MSSGFYLRKDQKTFGPLTAEDIAILKTNGEISNYSWIWTPETKVWAPLDLAPPSPETAEPVANAVMPKVTQITSKQKKPAATFQLRDTKIANAGQEAFRAILFDNRNAVTTWVVEASAEGCELRSDETGPDPYFVQKGHCSINLHEVASGKTTQVLVRISGVFRRDRQWIYKVRWTAVPSIFAPSKAA